MPTPLTPFTAGTNPSGPIPPRPIDPRSELTLDEQVAHYVDMWKKSVDVQQHFNDIEWRIRGLALTVATFAIGAAGVAARDGARVGCLSLGALVVVVGLILWYAFYFVDRVWYHPLLRAAVEQGTEIEKEIVKHLPKAGLTDTITTRSPQPVGRVVALLSRKPIMRSEEKLVWFYKVGASAFLVSIVALQIDAMLGDRGSEVPQRLDVRIVQPRPSMTTTSVSPGVSTAVPRTSTATSVGTPTSSFYLSPSVGSPS